MISESDRCPDEHEQGDTTRRDHQGAGRTILKETFGKGSKGLRVELNLKEDGWLGETVPGRQSSLCEDGNREKSGMASGGSESGKQRVFRDRGRSEGTVIRSLDFILT